MAPRDLPDSGPLVPSTVHVSARAVGAALKAFRRLGLDADAFLEEAGLEPDEIADPDDRLPYEKLLLVWIAALRESGDDYLGLRASQQVELGDYEILGYLARTCETVADQLAALHRYQRLLADAIEIEASLEGALVRLEYRAPEPHELPRPVAEYVIGVLIALGRATVGDALRVVDVCFRHGAPENAEECSRVLRAPVQFGAPHHSILVDVPLDHRISTGDTELHGILRRQADRLVTEHGSDPFVKEVSEVVEKAILSASGEALEVDQVAAKVDVTPRSLKRRLSEQGTSLTEITDALRRELAMHHLASTNLSVGEVGFLVGFSEPSAFHRAFRRWTNQTPAHFRAAGR